MIWGIRMNKIFVEIKKTVSVLLIAVLCFAFLLVGCNQTDEKLFLYKVDKDALLYETDNDSYSHYLNINSGINYAENDIVLEPNGVLNAYSGEYAVSSDGSSYAFIDANSRWIEWNIDIPKAAFYFFETAYKPVAGDGSDIALSLSVDGKIPYTEAANLTLFRHYKDDVSENFDLDSLGNDIRPTKTEIKEEIVSEFYDDKGYRNEPFGIALSAGTHTIRLSSVKNGVLIKKLFLKSKSEPVTYKEYISNFGNVTNTAKKSIIIEAEHPKYTTASNIFAVSDIQDCSTTPNSAKVTKLNAVGDSNWCHNGQTIAWSVNVKQDGLYAINIRARQDYSEGMNAYRSLKVDGVSPFKEAQSLKFAYDFDWKSVTVGGAENPMYIYLSKGTHELSLTATSGDLSSVLLQLEKLVLDFNTLYRKIIVVTGTEVDIYQDYSLDTKIPELVNSFKDCRNRTLKLSAKIKNQTGNGGSRASVLDEMVDIIDGFAEHPYSITGGLANFKTKVEDVASLLTNMSEQALLIDKITLIPKGCKIQSNNASLIEKCVFSIQKFVNSYKSDKDNTKNNKTIKVWASTGRDQAQIIKQMINNEFSNSYHINVDFNIVDTGATLIQAALANQGPDCAIMIAQDAPVNLAMRGGLIDLSKLGVDKLYGNYYESAWTPFRYQDGIYGIPETQIYDMMFIRDDIFNELSIDAPDTWDDFYDVLKTVQNNNLIVGLAETNSENIAISGGIGTYSKFYFQNGGTFYNKDFSATTFESELSIDCLKRVCELYTKYGIDREINFFNRFRSGELAIGIAPYNTYNQLVTAAPEINGLWSMYPIPGTLDKSGNINRAEVSTGTASIILKAAKNNKVQKEAFDFIKWWNDAKTQSEYANRLEGIMGTAARYTPANIKAFNSIKWSEKEKKSLSNQWEQVKNVREIPGNYYITRSLTSAIRNTISKGTSIRFNIAKYNSDINSEIKRKRLEFGLE